VLAAGSNRGIEVFDMAVEKSVMSMNEVHSKPVHTIRLNKPSPFASVAKESYDLFLTASTDNTMKLWDLRTDK
jgi:WD40 repeat protein